MDAASRKFAELEKRERQLGEREAQAEQAQAAAEERSTQLDEREEGLALRETALKGALVAGAGRWLVPFALCVPARWSWLHVRDRSQGRSACVGAA